MNSYLGRFIDLHRKVSACGYGFTDREVSLIMLMGLPKEYEGLILNLERDENFKNKGRRFLENVLYVPKLDGNLLSAGRIEEMGIYNNMLSRWQSRSQTEEVLLAAHRLGRLYKVKEEIAHKACTTKHEQVMRRRLGHFHKDAIKKLVKKDVYNQEEALDEGSICSTCILGKMRKVPFPKRETEQASKSLQLIHSDVAGPIKPISKGDFKCTVVDDYSRYVLVKPMKTKDQVLEKFIKYKNYVENFHE